ncbi:MAG: acetate--CoA ligase family protein, partial [Balneolaceae bacterium]|nr:acetate--CoA ligase family protein [Balneolaceae bacterium]
QRKEWLNIRRVDRKVFDTADRPTAQKQASEENWNSLLASYGINLPPQKKASGLEEALESAEEIGYPVVLKLISEQVTHKTEINGVKMGIDDADALKKAWDELAESADEAGVSMKGGLVQKMLTGGYEVIIGIRQDEQFGPLVLFGTGGTDVELLRDVATGIAPLNRLQAEQLVDQTAAGVKLKGWRNQPEADRETVIEYLMRMAQLADDLPAVQELEINPLYVLPKGKGAFAIDIRGTYSEDE